MTEPGSESFAVRFSRTYVETEMTLDVDQVVALFAEHAVLRTPEAVVEGRASLRAFYSDFLAPMAEIDLQLNRVVGDERTVAFEWLGTTRYRDGRWVRAIGCDVVTLEGGLVVDSMVHIHRIEEVSGA